MAELSSGWVAGTACTVLLYHKKKKKKTLFSKRTRFFYGYFCENCIRIELLFCAFLQKQKNKKFFCRFCNFSCRKIVSIVKGFFAAGLAVWTSSMRFCCSSKPWERAVWWGIALCGTRNQSGKDRPSGKMVWGWQNRNIPLVVFGKNDADCRFSPMLCPHFLFFL